jgi:transposase InsO family protein
MNAHVERFNRTIQESFVDYHEDLLFTDLDRFNQKLADWLVIYNAERPHHSGGQLPLTIPPPNSTRVPKVVDSYSACQSKIEMSPFCAK